MFSREHRPEKYFSFTWTNIDFADSPCIACIIHDETAMISLSKSNEQENYSKRIVASITHDLRTPLNGIMGIIDALEEFVFSEGKRFLGLAKNTGTLMLYLINDVLDMAQIEAKKLKLTKSKQNPKQIIEETIQLMKFNFMQKRVELAYWFSANIPKEIYTDMTRYRQILLNLLGNALKFTLKGQVSVSVFYDQKFELLITKVRDTGAGIPETDLPNLFKMFGKISNTEKINPNGVGLGLHICKQLSQQLGGDIFVESEVGEGSVFTFYIMCDLFDKSYTNGNYNEHLEKESLTKEYIKKVVDKVTIEEQKGESLQIATKQIELNDIAVKCTSVSMIKSGRSHLSLLHMCSGEICDCPKILIVDDNQMNLFVLSNYLKDTRLKPLIAYNGKEAINLVIEKSQGTCCTKFKMIYMDINMPIMNGIEATVKLREMMAKKEINEMPIIALSAGSASDLADNQEIFNEIIEKPISKEKFFNCLNKYCLSKK